MILKEKVYNQFQSLLNEKIDLLQNKLNDLRQSAANETKSSAGDKHETALAMLQIDQANSGIHLSELLQQKEVFDKINPRIKAKQIAIGSLIKTNHGYLFLTLALGKITVDGKTIIALSPQSPLGSQLVGLKLKDTVEVNGRKYIVEEIH